MVKISVIIPTLNEAKYLPKLLNSLKQQSFKSFEIIVADAGSKDTTVDLAIAAGAIVVRGGMPAVGRNNGAKIAQGEYLFFLDADVELPTNFLHNAMIELQGRKLGSATCAFVPSSGLMLDKALCKATNLYIKLHQNKNQHAAGFCIFASKTVFESVGGFNEQLTLAEDHDFVQRTSEVSPFGVLDSAYVVMSTRRLEKEGRLVLLVKYTKVELYRLFKGDMSKEVIEYEFGNFNRAKPLSHRLLRKMKNKLLTMGQKHSTDL